MRTPKLLAAAAAMLLLSASWATVPAHADDPTPPPADPAPADATPGGPAQPGSDELLLVMDSSGSMAEPTGGGQTRIQAAKSALHTVVDETPESLQLGLRVYGASVFDRSDPGACTDSELVVPIGADNRDQLRAEIDQYQPFGETPIAHSLAEAGKDLATTSEAEHTRTIVLVSDGEETCVPDPCPVAEQLARDGINVHVNVVGLNVAGTARDQLTCIADKGNGQYFDAENADELTDALTQIATRGGQGFEVEGEPVDGGPTAAEAATLTEGVHADSFSAEQKWYRVERPDPNSTIWVGAAGQAEDEAGGTTLLRVHLFEPETESHCGQGVSYDGGDSGASLFGAAAHTTDCDPSDEVLVKVEAELKNEAELPVRLNVVIEPPVANPEDLPETASSAPAWEAMAPTRAEGQPVRGGTSYDNAPVLTDGDTPVTLVAGETQIFAVDLDWGQRLQGQTVLHPVDEHQGQHNPYWFFKLYSPFGTEVDLNGVEGAPPSYDTKSAEEEVTIGASTAEVRYQNRSEYDRVGHTALPGRYYLVVSTGALTSAEEESQEFPATMQVKITGTAGEGEPEYLEPTPTPEPGAPESGSGSEAPGTSGGGDAGGGSEGPTWGLIGGLGGGAVLLAGMGGGLIWWLRRS